MDLDAGFTQLGDGRAVGGVTAADGVTLRLVVAGQAAQAYAAYAHEMQMRFTHSGSVPSRFTIRPMNVSSGPSGELRALFCAACASRPCSPRGSLRSSRRPLRRSCGRTMPAPASAKAVALWSWWFSAADGRGTMIRGTP